MPAKLIVFRLAESFNRKGEIEMKRKASGLLVVLIICGLIGLIGCVPNQGQKKGKEVKQVETTKPSTQEWKTYVSKYGFSVSYPANWKLEEDDYALLERKMEKGKVPFSLTDGKVNYYQFGTTYFENANEIQDNKKRTELVNKLNLLLNIDGGKEVAIRNGHAYVLWGDSKRNKNAKFIISLIAITKNDSIQSKSISDNILLIQEEVFQKDKIDFMLNNFLEMLKWIKIT